MAGEDSSRRLFRRIFKGQSLRGEKLPKNEPSTIKTDPVSSGSHGKSEEAHVDGVLEGLGSSLWFEAYTDFVTSSTSPNYHHIAKRLRKESEDAFNLHQQDVDRHMHDTSPELTVCKEVLVAAQQRQSALKKDADRSVTRRLRHACDGVAKWAQKFAAVGDIVAQADPIHVGLPWAGVRAILMISIHDQKSQAETLEGVAQLSKLVCRYAAFEQVYLYDHSMLQESLKLRLGSLLKELYIAMFAYLIEVNIFFERSSARKVLDSLVPSEVLQNLYETVRKKEAELLRYEAMSVKDSSYRQYIQVRRILSTYEDHLEVEKRTKICNWISQIEYYSHYREMRSTVLANTGDWFLNRQEFQKWRDSEESALLWLRGNAGTGKTCLISCAIDRFLEIHGLDEKEALAYFYCSRTTSDTRQQDPKAILLSIVRQISAAVPGLPLKPPIISMYERETARGSREASLSIDEISSLLMELIQDHYDRVILIVDALDECKIADRSLLLQTLSKLTYNHRTIVKTLVSSRNDHDIESHFSKTPNLSITATDNASDIARYVQTSIDERLLSGKAKKQIRDRVRKALITKAGGVFRWVALQVDALCDPVKVFTEADIDHLLLSLPSDLEATYGRILDDLDRSYPPPSRATIRNVLKLLLCAEWPMSSRVVLGSLRLLSGNGQEDLNKTKILRMGRGLIVGGARRGFAFAHLSVREFLEKQIDFDGKRAHATAAEACLRAYLDPTTNDFCWYALSHLGRHCSKSQGLRQETQIRSLMEDFLLKTESNEAFERWNRGCFQTDIELARGTCNERRRCQSRPAQPLLMASVYDFDDFAQILLKENINALYAENFYHERPLEVAAYHGNYSTMVILYNAAASEQKASIRDDQWLRAAAASSTIDVWNFARNRALGNPSQEVLFKAAENPQHSREMVSSLLDGMTDLDERCLAGILESCASLQTVEIITPYLAPDRLNESILSAAAKNRFINPELTEMILSKSKIPRISASCVVDAALRGGRSSKAAVIQLFLQHPGGCEITEESLCLIARFCNEQTVECLRPLLIGLSLQHITQDLLKAAAENIFDGPAILAYLLSRPIKLEISQHVLQGAIQNHWRPAESFDQFAVVSERPRLLEESLYVLTETSPGDGDVLPKVMAECEAFQFTEAFLQACAANRSDMEMEYVLDLPRAFPISEGLVRASLTNFKDADAVLSRLLRTPESFKLEASEDLLLLALSNESKALELVRILSEIWKFLPVTENVLAGAVRHRRVGMEIYDLLLQHSDCVDEMLTEKVLRAGVEGDNVDFVEFYKQQRSDFAVDETLLKAAIAPYSANNAILRILLLQKNRCPVSQILLRAANDVKWNNPSALELIVEHSEITQLDQIALPATEISHPFEKKRRFEASEEIDFQTLVSAASEEGEPEVFSYVLGTTKLDELMSIRKDPISDSSRLVEAAARRRDGKFIVQYLLSRFPETTISYEALRCAVTNKEALTSLLDLLLRNYKDAVDSELLQLAASNQYRGTQMVEVLLHYFPADLEISKDVIAAGLKNRYCGQSIFELILARQPQFDITEELVDAVSENDVLGKILLQRFLDRALTIQSSTSAELVLRKIKGTETGLRDSLFTAACYGQDIVLDFLILHRVPLSTVSGELGTALNVAVYAGNVNVVKILLENGSDPESRSKHYGTALGTACRNGNVDIIRLLVSHGADVDRHGDMERTRLHIAAREGHSKVVDALLSLGASANSTDCQGLSALHHAATHSEPSTCINQLLQAGAVLDQKDLQQWTPLHWAAKAGATDAVAQLLAAGADRTETDANERAPLHVALHCGYVYLRPKLYYPRAPDVPIKPVDTEQMEWWCDVCDMDTQGPRFKCDKCSDYDLCFRCILDAKRVHDPEHEFSEIEESKEDFSQVLTATSKPFRRV